MPKKNRRIPQDKIKFFQHIEQMKKISLEDFDKMYVREKII